VLNLNLLYGQLKRGQQRLKIEKSKMAAAMVIKRIDVISLQAFFNKRQGEKPWH